MRKWFYVLELEGPRYYVGISNTIDRRLLQHATSTGAEWTRAHKPVRVLLRQAHDVADDIEARRIEDQMTVGLMLQHHWKKVRGGHFCHLDESSVEAALRAHGHWDQILQAEVQGCELSVDWHEAAAIALQLAETFHLAGCPPEGGEQVLSHLLGMKEHRHWRPDLEPGLKEQFWGHKGLLPVLLSLKLDRVIGFKLPNPYGVLAAALQRGRGNVRPWNHLFLAAWQAFRPTATPRQEQTVAELLAAYQPTDADRQYDPIVTILFPEMRWLLRP